MNWIRSDFIDEEIGLVKSSGFVSMRTSDSYLPDFYQWYTHESALGHQMIQDEASYNFIIGILIIRSLRCSMDVLCF